MSDNDPEILRFAFPEPGEHPPLPVERAPRNYDACKHSGTIIDKDARVLSCKLCGVSLDPIEYLYQLACTGSRLQSRIDEIREHEARKRDKAAMRSMEEREKVPITLARVKRGARLRVWYRRMRSDVRFVERTDDSIIVKPPFTAKPQTIPIAEIDRLVVLKHAT